MEEKVITLYDSAEKQICGIIIVEEIELGYLNDKVVMYSKSAIKTALIPFLTNVSQSTINISLLIKRIAMWLKTAEETESIKLLEPYTLISENKNKSSRNKKMIEDLKLPYKLERSCCYFGKKGN